MIRLKIINARMDGCEVHAEQLSDFQVMVKLIGFDGEVVEQDTIHPNRLFKWIEQYEDW